MKKNDMVIAGLMLTVAQEELSRRVQQYEEGTLPFTKEAVLRDLKAANNAGRMFNEMLLDFVEGRVTD